MSSVIILFFLLSTGAVFGTVLLKKEYSFEEYIPVSCMAVVLWLFGFGLVGALKAGMISLLVLCTGIWIAGIAAGIRDRDRLKGLFTPGFCVYIAMFAVTAFVCYGQMAHVLDEFSHWALVVKEMYLTNQLSVSPEVQFTFYKHYPPAMSIFQYFLLKLGRSFDEWKMYFAYQIFMLSFFLPFMRKLNFKKLPAYFAIAALWLGILAFYPCAYMEIYIDPFLAVVTGCGFATVMTADENNNLSRANIFLSAAILVLSKEIGIMPAIFLILAYVLREKRRKALWSFSFAAVPAILWKTALKVHGVVKPESGKIDPVSFLHVITGKETLADSYRPHILKAFFIMLRGKSEAGISCIIVILLLAAALILLAIKYRRLGTGLACIGLAVSYTFGMLLMYMYIFPHREAVVMASFTRYIGVALGSMLITALIALLLLPNERKSINIFAALAVVLLLTPYGQLWQYINRHAVGTGILTRAYAETWCRELTERYEPGSRICYGRGETATTEFFETRYILAPEYDVYWVTE